jgi:AAA domain
MPHSAANTQLSPSQGLSQSYPHGRIEVHTVDKFQGRDKDCIIVSLVRANQSKTVTSLHHYLSQTKYLQTFKLGDLLKDWRRVNVAFTRAKKKLVVIGSLSTLQSSPLFSQFLDLLEQHNWISFSSFISSPIIFLHTFNYWWYSFDTAKIYNLPPGAHTFYRGRAGSNSAPVTTNQPNDTKQQRVKKTFGLKTARRSILKNILDAT